jgi:predicted molibdopterin-dependent oxidoreductase YjgC
VGETQDFSIRVDGQALPAKTGQTVAAVLLSAGWLAWNRSAVGAPRGVFCGMGVCYDCVVTINGLPDQRACITPAVPGMHVETRHR